MRIAFFSAKNYDKEHFNHHTVHHTITFFETGLDEHSVNLAAGYKAICVFVNDKINAKVIKALKKLGVEIIALRCAGFNNVDLAAAKENDIQVVRVPAYSPHAVAEHAVALILTLNRKTHKAYNRVKEGNFSLEKLTGFDLYGKTVGVIGTGKIGQIFCDIMMGFGCKVLAFDTIANKEMEAKGVQYLPLMDLLQQADIISIHCPLTEQTKHLVNNTTIGYMKKGVMIINTSRGAIIDAHAIIKSLKNGKVGYLGMDVYEQEDTLFFNDLSESIIKDDIIARLISFPNVLVTSHQGFFTEEALTQIATVTIQNLTDYENKAPLVNKVQL